MAIRDTSLPDSLPRFPHTLGDLRPLPPSPFLTVSHPSPYLTVCLPPARDTATDVSTGNNHIALPLWHVASGTSHYWRACAGKDGTHGQKKFRQAQAQRTAIGRTAQASG